MRRALAKINIVHLAVAVLLLASLWFASAREAHSLCFRLLLHLRGATFVQGQPPGCITYTIPNVWFTEQKTKVIRAHSKDSLDAFALASVTEDPIDLESPAAQGSWKDHPLLEWAVFRLVWASVQQGNTNRPALLARLPMTEASAREAIKLAQSMDVSNGALWLAEASLDFTDEYDDAALVALQMAATNGQWKAVSREACKYIAGLFEAAGLSKLDAANQADIEGTGFMAASFVQSSSCNNLMRLMTQAIDNRDDQKFLKLFGLLISLRRGDWIDTNPNTCNAFRRISITQGFSDDLINAMAKRMGQAALPDADLVRYEQVKETRRQIFQDYFKQFPGQDLVMVFKTQDESYPTEFRLRRQLNETKFYNLVLTGVFTSIAGALAAFSLAVTFFFAVCEVLAWRFKGVLAQPRALLRDKKFRAGFFIVIVMGTLVFWNLGASLGLDSQVGLVADAPPPLISPMVEAIIISAGVSMLLVVLVLLPLAEDWRLGKNKYVPGLLTLVMGGIYLITILVMAYYRSSLVQAIAAPYKY